MACKSNTYPTDGSRPMTSCQCTNSGTIEADYPSLELRQIQTIIILSLRNTNDDQASGIVSTNCSTCARFRACRANTCAGWFFLRGTWPKSTHSRGFNESSQLPPNQPKHPPPQRLQRLQNRLRRIRSNEAPSESDPHARASYKDPSADSNRSREFPRPLRTLPKLSYSTKGGQGRFAALVQYIYPPHINGIAPPSASALQAKSPMQSKVTASSLLFTH